MIAFTYSIYVIILLIDMNILSVVLLGATTTITTINNWTIWHRTVEKIFLGRINYILIAYLLYMEISLLLKVGNLMLKIQKL